MYALLRVVPKNLLSRIVGRLVHLPLPRMVSTRLIRWFAGRYGIAVEEASRPIEEYRSLGEFFVRDLRPGLRPVEGPIVSPVDGHLRSRGLVHDGEIVQIKGKTYSLRHFLAAVPETDLFDGGLYFNLYLSPRDYHHVHSPVDGRVVRSVHIPGALWPVNDWSMSTIDNLFGINERVVTILETEQFGHVAVVMVGATNVGSMTVTYDDFITNVGRREPVHRDYPSRPRLAAGDRLGTFHMGSSVVVLLERDRFEPSDVTVPDDVPVRLGQRLIDRS